jgi:hypothetical protein
MNNHHSPFWPLTVGILTLIVLLGWQLNFTFQARSNMQKQIEAQKDNVTQAAESAKKIQGELEGIVNDLLKLAETEPAARVVVDKYQIRRNADAAPEAAKP